MKPIQGQIAVVIVAGGSGTRLGGSVAKQFLMLMGQPVFEWSLHHFANNDLVAEICLVVPAADLEQVMRRVKAKVWPVPVQVVAGGESRQESVAAGLATTAMGIEYVAVHDGARPFPPDNLRALLEAARSCEGAVTGMPATDCIKTVAREHVTATLPREGLWTIQTPQVFRTVVLSKALQYCREQEIIVADDASAVEAMGGEVRVVPGKRSNLKLTYPEDISMAEAIIAGRGGNG